MSCGVVVLAGGQDERVVGFEELRRFLSRCGLVQQALASQHDLHHTSSSRSRSSQGSGLWGADPPLPARLEPVLACVSQQSAREGGRATNTPPTSCVMAAAGGGRGV